MELLSPLQINLLQNLVFFKQLTIPQFTKLNKSSSKQSIRRALEKIYRKRKPLINRVEFKKVSHFGRLSYVYSLSAYGVQSLEKTLKRKVEIETFTPSHPKLTDDYFHRTSTIDFQIYIYSNMKRENFKILSCDHYFVVKKIAKSFQPINKIKLDSGIKLIPDLVILFSKDNKRRWALFELHNGSDKKRIVEQIKIHSLCLIGLSAHKKYNIEFARFYYILILFEKDSVMKAVINDISKDMYYRNVLQFFLCKSIAGLKKTFLCDWLDLSGSKAEIKFQY